MTESLTNAILQQAPEYTNDIMSDQLHANVDMHSHRRQPQTSNAACVKESLPSSKRAKDLATEKSASSWLIALPKDEFGFCLHEGVFWDSLALC